MRYISEALDQYTGICKEALQDCASKLSKSFESVIIEVLLLYMVIPGKINFTQMGRYGRHCEQCYRQNFGRLRSKSLNWLRFNALGEASSAPVSMTPSSVICSCQILSTSKEPSPFYIPCDREIKLV